MDEELDDVLYDDDVDETEVPACIVETTWARDRVVVAGVDNLAEGRTHLDDIKFWKVALPMWTWEREAGLSVKVPNPGRGGSSRAVLGGDVRSDWTPECVREWLRSRGVAEGIADRLYESDVDGQTLYALFFDGHAGNMEPWRTVGLYTDETDAPKVRAVLEACRDLEVYSWVLPCAHSTTSVVSIDGGRYVAFVAPVVLGEPAVYRVPDVKALARAVHVPVTVGYAVPPSGPSSFPVVVEFTYQNPDPRKLAAASLAIAVCELWRQTFHLAACGREPEALVDALVRGDVAFTLVAAGRAADALRPDPAPLVFTYRHDTWEGFQQDFVLAVKDKLWGLVGGGA